MGSPAAVVEISSDDEDGWRAPGAAAKRNSTGGGLRTPGAAKHPPDGGGRTPAPGAPKDNPSNSGLEWAKKLLDEECDEIGEGLADSAEMQEFWASLIDGTDIVVDAKKNLVDEPEKKGLHDADDDDDDCVILDGDPEKAVVVAKEEGPRHDAAEVELQIVAEKGELACRDFPHPRHLCASLPFSTSSHANHCSMCHCYVCDSRAPCAFWGKGTGINDHCHATDKDAKWKILRQSSKRKSQQTPKLGGVQNLPQSISTRSTNAMVPSTGRFPVSSAARQIQQMHASIMISQNMMQGVSRPRAPSPVQRTASTMVSQNMMQGVYRSRAPSPVQRTTIPSKRSKRARVAPPVHTASNVNYMQHSVPSYSPMQQTFPRGLQAAQVPQGNTFWSSPHLPSGAPPSLRAPNGSQGYQRQAIPYPLVTPNTVVGTGVPLSRCTSLSTQGKQQPQGPSTDTSRTLKDALTNLAHELGVPDYNIDPPVGQQSASSHQNLYPDHVLALAKASQGVKISSNHVASQGPLRMRLSSGHNSSIQAPGSTVISSDSIQARQPLCQLNSQSSLVPNQTDGT